MLKFELSADVKYLYTFSMTAVQKSLFMVRIKNKLQAAVENK